MIDFHTHILPCLDDGAKDVETATKMLQSELEQGVQTVVFTSHYYGKTISPSAFLEERKKAMDSLQPYIPSALNVRLGAEVHFTGINLPDYDQLCHLAIEGTRYILLELPFTTKWTEILVDRIYDFGYETGLIPIIAHVERYLEVLRKPSILSDLVGMGCLLQVNARAFTDKWERSLAFALLKRGWVHCIGSDAHDMDMRAPCLATAKKAFEETGGLQEWEQIQATMAKILDNKEVFCPKADPIKKFFGKYR